MQNEILKTMALQVLRQVMESIHSAPFLTIMIDETTHVSNKEQVVICFRWVDKKKRTKSLLESIRCSPHNLEFY